MSTDIEIARTRKSNLLQTSPKNTRLTSDDLNYYGKYKAKVPLKYINEEK